MNFLAVETPTSNYNDFYNRKMFWEDNFTPANMRSCGLCNVSKQKEINNSDQYIALEISLKLYFMDNR